MKKGLQKLTEIESKINMLMRKEKVEQADVDEVLNKEEKKEFSKYLAKKLTELKGDKRDELIDQIAGITPANVKNQLWENNHYIISAAISKLIEEYGKMPTNNHIAEQTGLSRQTIAKHLKDYANHPIYAEEMRKFRFMADRVLAKIFKIAVKDAGNVKAARLYFEVLGYLGGRSVLNTLINTQNNYIQINDTVLNQEAIKKLNPEQLQTIETILKTALTRPGSTEARNSEMNMESNMNE